MPVTILAYSLSQCVLLSFDTRFSSSGQNVIQIPQCCRRRGDCRDAGSCRSPGAPQQSDDADLEMRIQRLENQLRQLTGQNEELQYRNRQLEDRLRQLGAAPPAPGGQPPARSPTWPRPRRRFSPPRRRPQQGYPQQAGRLSASPTRLRPAAADRFTRADRAGPGSPAGRRPPPRRCLRPEPESQRPGRAARARRRPDADLE